MQAVHNKASKFDLGQIVEHERHHYRGVIYDVDPQFMLPDDCYDRVATAHASKDQPWYRLLVDGARQEAYVPEQSLSAEADAEPVDHPAVGQIFEEFCDGRYKPRHVMN